MEVKTNVSKTVYIFFEYVKSSVSIATTKRKRGELSVAEIIELNCYFVFFLKILIISIINITLFSLTQKVTNTMNVCVRTEVDLQFKYKYEKNRNIRNKIILNENNKSLLKLKNFN